MLDYGGLSHDDFTTILQDVIEDNVKYLLSIPGIYEVLSEEFNNEVLDRWEQAQAEA